MTWANGPSGINGILNPRISSYADQQRGGLTIYQVPYEYGGEKSLLTMADGIIFDENSR